MKKIGDIIKDHAIKKAPTSKMWKEVLRVINLPDKEKQAHYRKVAIEMQQDKDRDTIPYTRHWIEKVKDKDDKEKKVKCKKKYYCKVRKTQFGEEVMLKQGETVAKLGTRVYDLIKDGDGYEWLKLREAKKDESFEDVPF